MIPPQFIDSLWLCYYHVWHLKRASALIGQTISHYRILQKLGRGGMGEVYLAQDSQLGRNVAVKFLPSDIATDERAKQRLLREARTAATLDHPNICAIYDVGQEGDSSFIVFQYIRVKPWQLGSGASVLTCMRRSRLPSKSPTR